MLERTPDLALIWLSGGFALACPQVEETMGTFIKQVRQLPGYHQVWRGAPASIKDYQARHWVQRQPNYHGFQLEHNDFMDYRYPTRPNVGQGSPRKSFASAVAVLVQLAGHLPQEVVVFTLL